MRTLRVGDILIQAKEDGLCLRDCNNLSNLGGFKLDDIPAVMEFMKSFLEDSANRRSSFRIELTDLPLSDYHRIDATLLTTGGKFTLKPLDISLTGMLVDSDEYCGVVGEDVMVNLGFDTMRVVISAKIVRANESSRRIALHFPDVIRADGTVDAPLELNEIFRALESCWLDKRLGLDWNAA